MGDPNLTRALRRWQDHLLTAQKLGVSTYPAPGLEEKGPWAAWGQSGVSDSRTQAPGVLGPHLWSS